MSRQAANALVPRRCEPFSLDRARVEPLDMFLLSLVDGTTSLGDICELMPCPKEEALRRAHKLVRGGVLEITGGAEAPAAPSAWSVAEPASGRPCASDLRKLKRVEELLGQLEQLDARSLLGPTADASLSELRSACARLIAAAARADRASAMATGREPTARAPVIHAQQPFADPPSTVHVRGPSRDHVAWPPSSTQDGSAPTPLATLRSHALRAEADCMWKEAVAAWRECLEREPGSRMATLRLAHCLLESGDARLAMRYAREASRAAPNDLEARLMLGRVYETLGLNTSAKQQRDVACELNRLNKRRPAGGAAKTTAPKGR